MKTYIDISTLIKSLFLFFVLMAFVCVSQPHQKIDSLHRSFNRTVLTDLKTTIINAKEAIVLRETLEDEPLLLKSYLNLSKVYYLSGFYDKAKVSAKKGRIILLLFS